MTVEKALAATVIIMDLAANSPKILFGLYEIANNPKISVKRRREMISKILYQYHQERSLSATINARAMLEWLRTCKPV